MSIRIDYASKSKKEITVKGGDMPVGAVMLGTVAGYDKSLWLRHYDGIVRLDNPGSTWGCTGANTGPKITGRYVNIVVKLEE